MSLHTHAIRVVSGIAFVTLLTASSGTATGQNGEPFDPMEATIQQVQQAMEFGIVTRSSRTGSRRRHFLWRDATPPSNL